MIVRLFCKHKNMTNIRIILDDTERNLSIIKQKTITTEQLNHCLIKYLVEQHESYRIAKNYQESDKIRSFLLSHKIKIIQGTSGMTFDEVKKKYKDMPYPMNSDTWEFI
jgi:cysteinyl-tRNA synthetase